MVEPLRGEPPVGLHRKRTIPADLVGKVIKVESEITSLQKTQALLQKAQLREHEHEQSRTFAQVQNKTAEIKAEIHQKCHEMAHLTSKFKEPALTEESYEKLHALMGKCEKASKAPTDQNYKEVVRASAEFNTVAKSRVQLAREKGRPQPPPPTRATVTGGAAAPTASDATLPDEVNRIFAKLLSQGGDHLSLLIQLQKILTGNVRIANDVNSSTSVFAALKNAMDAFGLGGLFDGLIPASGPGIPPNSFVGDGEAIRAKLEAAITALNNLLEGTPPGLQLIQDKVQSIIDEIRNDPTGKYKNNPENQKSDLEMWTSIKNAVTKDLPKALQDYASILKKININTTPGSPNFQIIGPPNTDQGFDAKKWIRDMSGLEKVVINGTPAPNATFGIKTVFDRINAWSEENSSVSATQQTLLQAFVTQMTIVAGALNSASSQLHQCYMTFAQGIGGGR